MRRAFHDEGSKFTEQQVAFILRQANRNIEVFSLSALKVLAMATGTFVVLLPDGRYGASGPNAAHSISGFLQCSLGQLCEAFVTVS